MIDPKSFEAHYELGKMALGVSALPLIGARALSGIPVGQKGRIRDAEIRHRMQIRLAS